MGTVFPPTSDGRWNPQPHKGDDVEFTTTPTEVIDEDPIDFTVDGNTYTAVRPTPAQMMMVVIDWQHGEEERAAAVVATFEAIVTPSAPLMARLYDRTDPFDLADVWRIMAALTDEWNTLDAAREAKTHLRLVGEV